MELPPLTEGWLSPRHPPGVDSVVEADENAMSGEEGV